jgi:non-specific serine/threonine protein kinase
MIGTNLSHYEILSRIGAGGMGEVYRARDQRLDRHVAIKVLPPTIATDPDRLASFIQEAKTLASLNHPNIASIYGLESRRGGEQYIVLELVEGESLADRIRRGPIPVGETVALLTQVCDALAATHERGIIHRDVKPRNIMVTPHGAVKVLDFGIAQRVSVKASRREDAQGAETVTWSPFAGAGTPQYMSPEQIENGAQDPSSDIFAFGCVLYECLSALRAFPGETVADTFLRILRAEPAWDRLPADLPANVLHLLKGCLAKAPSARPPTMRAVREMLTEAFRPQATAGAPAGRLPQPLNSFVGREQELDACGGLLKRMRLVTLTGIGGSGKTRLALELAQRQIPFTGHVWFADLSDLEDPTRVADAVARSIGLTAEPGRPMREALLVLDNCEQVASACATMAARILTTSPKIRILATSREILGIPGEQVYPVPPLSLDRGEAVQLFEERARQASPTFRLSEQDRATVKDICRRLDGIPLAIELAAARTVVLSVEQIRAMLDDVFRLLAGGGSALPRHQTLATAIRWSYEHLGESERCFLRELSVFAGGASLEGAMHIAGTSRDEFQTLDLLTQLVDRSLVVVERPEGSARYRLPETVRQFARAALRDAGEEAGVTARHLRYFVDFTELALPNLAGPQQAAWLARLERERENLVAALAACDADPDGAELGLRLVGAARLFWLFRGHFELGTRLCREALARSGGERATPERARALFAAGSLAYAHADYGPAERMLGESADIFERERDAEGVASALYMKGTAQTSMGRLGDARVTLERAVVMAREAGSTLRLASALNSLSVLLRMEGAIDESAARIGEALVAAKACGSVGTAATCVLNMGAIAVERRRADEARASIREALTLLPEVKSVPMTQALMDLAAATAALIQDDLLAARFYGASDAFLERVGGRRESTAVRFLESYLGEARQRSGDAAFEEAVTRGRGLATDDAIAEIGAWAKKQ